MNKKYLFGMLLSGAMLAACTAEDDLNLAKVNKDVNPEAPVFVVSFDDADLQNRGVYTDNKVNFLPNDLLSLYHGITADATSEAASLTGYGNAIYKGTVEDDQYKFSTEAMVKSGKAIMVYPADTTGVWETNEGTGLYITLSNKQDAKTTANTPYMSEVLTIGVNTEHKEKEEAGYGRQYDIIMRRAASTINMTLNRHGVLNMPESVEPITYTSVTLSSKVQGDANGKLFASKIEVKAGTEESVARQLKSGSTTVYNHDSWKNQSVLDVENAECTYDAITTEDITGNLARFTLLPSPKTPDDGNVRVNTRYGYVDMGGKGAQNRWWTDKVQKRSTNYAGDSASVGEGLVSFFSIAWANARSGTFFKDADHAEKVGAYMSVGLHVDIEKLNMDGLHIKDAKHLRDAIAVFNANFDKKTEAGAVNAVKFILEGNDKGKFEMDEQTWSAVLTQLAKNASTTKNSSIEFKPCDETGKVCNAIVLDSKGAVSEVPALQFGYSENGTTTAHKSGYEGLNLELKGKNWTYTSTAFSTTDNQNNAKNISGIKEIHVLKDATLTPSGFVATKANVAELVIDEGGVMNVESLVKFQMNVLNKGVINIDAEKKGQLIMEQANDATTLTNWADDKQDTNKTKTGLMPNGHKYGVINNGYSLGVNEQNTKPGAILNYGYIKVLNDDAATFVTTNGTADADFALNYANKENGKDNRIGVIELPKPTNSYLRLGNNAKEGIIKTNINPEKAGLADYNDFGGEACVANYFVLGSNAKQIDYAAATQFTAAVGLPKSQDIYIETDHDIEIKGTISLNGLVVNNNARVVIANGTTSHPTSVKVLNFYVPGTGSVYAAGTLTDKDGGKNYDQDGYYGSTNGLISGPGVPAN